MKVLVTGSDGYIGSVLVPLLLQEGHEPVGLDCRYFQDCILDGGAAPVPTIEKDIRDVGPEDLEGIDAVIHLSALCNDPLGDLNPDWTHDINHRASVRLAALAREAGVRRFLFSSSCSLYGASGDAPVAEDSPVRPLTAYARSKVMTEQEVSLLGNDRFSPVFLRNSTVYGSSPRWRADVVLNNLVAWAMTTGKIRLQSDGTAWRPLIHVEDLARAFVAFLAAPTPVIHGQAVNVGWDTQNYQVRGLAEIVARVVPGATIEYAPGGGPDPRNYRVDFSKIRRLLPAWSPAWDARRGAEELLARLRRAGVTAEDFQGRRFTRLKQIRHLLDGGMLDGTLRFVRSTVAA
jgi:nucleoside-diphosphate-sugar epimerase